MTCKPKVYTVTTRTVASWKGRRGVMAIPPDARPEVLIPRGNIYCTTSGYSWSYKGEACSHLAFAMVSVIYEFVRLEPYKRIRKTSSYAGGYLFHCRTSNPCTRFALTTVTTGICSASINPCTNNKLLTSVSRYSPCNSESPFHT